MCSVLLLAAGIEAVAAGYEKRTKACKKERPTEAPFLQLVLLFFVSGTMSGKPVAAQNKTI
jgi:hypothetical protein